MLRNICIATTALLGFAGLLAPAHAGLVWEKTLVQDTADPADSAYTATFPFKNDGNTAITIENVQTSCGCTAASLDKRLYGSGDSGEITVTFEYEDRMGAQPKQVFVQTDDPDNPAHLLRLDITIPIAIEPRILSWQSGATRKPKTLSLHVDQPEPVRLLDVSAKPDVLNLTHTAETPGRRYTIKAAPKDAAQPTQGQIALLVDVGREEPVRYTARFRIEGHSDSGEQPQASNAAPQGSDAANKQNSPPPQSRQAPRLNAQAIEVTPRMAVWRAGDDPTPQTLRVRITGESALPLGRVELSNKSFAAELTAIEEGREYHLRITPTSTASKARAVVRVHAAKSAGGSPVLTTIASILPAAK